MRYQIIVGVLLFCALFFHIASAKKAETGTEVDALDDLDLGEDADMQELAGIQGRLKNMMKTAHEIESSRKQKKYHHKVKKNKQKKQQQKKLKKQRQQKKRKQRQQKRKQRQQKRKQRQQQKRKQRKQRRQQQRQQKQKLSQNPIIDFNPSKPRQQQPIIATSSNKGQIVLNTKSRLITPEPLNTPVIALNPIGLSNNWVADTSVVGPGSPIPKVLDPMHVSPVIERSANTSPANVDAVVKKYTSVSTSETKDKSAEAQNREMKSKPFTDSSSSSSSSSVKTVIKNEVLTRLDKLESKIRTLNSTQNSPSSSSSKSQGHNTIAGNLDDLVRLVANKAADLIEKDVVDRLTDNAQRTIEKKLKNQEKKIAIELEELKTFEETRRKEDKSQLEARIESLPVSSSSSSFSSSSFSSSNNATNNKQINAVKSELQQVLQSDKRQLLDTERKLELKLEKKMDEFSSTFAKMDDTRKNLITNNKNINDIVPTKPLPPKEYEKKTKKAGKELMKLLNEVEGMKEGVPLPDFGSKNGTNSTSGVSAATATAKDVSDLQKLLQGNSPMLLETMKMARKAAQPLPEEDEDTEEGW